MAYDLAVMADNVFKSRLFPINSKEAAYTLMLVAESEGVHPMKALQMYDLIPGKPPRMKATEMQSRFQKNGGKIQWKKRTDNECVLWGSHPSGGELEVTWTMERAKLAGLATKDNWKKYPAQMLASKAIAELVRALYPDCLNGMYSADECGESIATTFTEEPKNSTNANATKSDVCVQDAVVVTSEEDLKNAVNDLNEQDELYKKITELAGKITEEEKRNRAFAWLDKTHSLSDCRKMLTRCEEIVKEQEGK